MTTPDKLSRERLEYFLQSNISRAVTPANARGGKTVASPDEERSMATEILELREEVERLRRTGITECMVGAPTLPPTATAQAMQSPDPEIVRLRLRVDALEQAMTPKPPPRDTRPIGDGRPGSMPPPLQIYFGAPLPQH